jgi:hypothetical protein
MFIHIGIVNGAASVQIGQMKACGAFSRRVRRQLLEA